MCKKITAYDSIRFLRTSESSSLNSVSTDEDDTDIVDGGFSWSRLANKSMAIGNGCGTVFTFFAFLSGGGVELSSDELDLLFSESFNFPFFFVTLLSIGKGCGSRSPFFVLPIRVPESETPVVVCFP